jgi:hypothetical protein
MHAGKTGQDHASDALIENIVRRSERFPAVNGYHVAALHKASGKLVCKRLKPAVAGGNTASTDDGDVHGKTFDL